MLLHLAMLCLLRGESCQCFERSLVPAGRGLGMEPFKPNRGPLKLSENMIIDNLAKVLDISTETVDSIADISDEQRNAESPNDWRVWSAEEAQAAIGNPLRPSNGAAANVICSCK